MLPFLLCAWVVAGISPMATTASDEITLWLLTASPDGALARGTQLGAEEMTRTTSLLGRTFVLRQAPVSPSPSRSGLLGTIRRSRGPTFVVLDLDGGDACQIVSELANAPRVIVLDARVESAPCGAPHLALRLPLKRREEALKEAGIQGGSLRLDEWHPSLERFGAQELNERYERQTHARMTGDAWAGWFAAKAAAEAALRVPRLNRSAIVGANGPAFDGHKGVPLRFNPSGLLEQPVYIFDISTGKPGKVVKEVS